MHHKTYSDSDIASYLAAFLPSLESTNRHLDPVENVAILSANSILQPFDESGLI